MQHMRRQLIKHLVDQVHAESWQRLYRKKNVGLAINGWPARLKHYSWATRSNPDLVSHLIWLNSMAQRVKAAVKSQDKNQIALDILKWGGVTRGNIGRVQSVTNDVIKSAIKGSQCNNAPMNSGWTKIAAVFSFPDPKARPQVIWDSRVSLSVCVRLGEAARCRRVKPADLQKCFKNALGWVAGRGGNRPVLRQCAQTWFPNRYGRWDAHFQGGSVSSEIAEILNSNPKKYGSPRDAVSEDEVEKLKKEGAPVPYQWTPWLVACVLFMDGQ